MEEPRQQPESLSNCRNVPEVAYYVRSKVELCIQNYMSLDVTAKYLEKTHHISKSVTRIVWEQLREENPLFFSHFEMRCQMALQMRMFNDMLTKQAVGMFEHGLLDICDASPSVRALLRREQPERVHLLETLASKTKLSSAGFVALPYGPSVAQILNNQQDQVLNSASFSMPNLNGPLVAQSQNPYYQQNQVPNPYDQQYQVLSSARLALSNPNGPSAAHMQILHNQQEQVLNNPARFAMPNPSGASVVQSQNPYEQVLNSESFAMPNPSGPSVVQSHMSNDQSNDLFYSEILAVPDANGPPVTQLPSPYDHQQEQQDKHLYTPNTPSPYANGPSVTQLPVPNNQQDQPHQNPSPTDNNDLISPTVAPADNDDWLQFIDPAALPDFGDLPPSDTTTTNPWSSFDYTSWFDPLPEEPSMFELGGDMMSAGMDLDEQEQHLDGQYQPHWQQQQQQNVQVEGNNGLENGDDFDIAPPMQTDTSEQLAGGVNHHHPVSEALNNPESGVTGHNGPSDSYIKTAEQPQDLNGHYQPQQNVPVEETLQRGGRSNGVVNGESNDKSHSKRMCTSRVHQSGRVKRHHPEHEALNNPNSGNGSQTTGVKQQRSPEARATTRSLKEWEQYESEETKQ
ncbi:uncharacterized protein LOC108852110 [Raphanus sativus]|uniref:Uncharacterized protein LOC108852110 n=1 Tax=Raphanus sativus TaxID=3726 RepID=A0A6J0NB95_RAPSA|nr:uncharacterized protein LOC108852110 [Raphanus sativus]